jgi:hypothetical protein
MIGNWDQPHRDQSDSHNDEDSDETNTPEMSDEDDIASIMNLPPAKPKMGDIMDDDNEAADIMTKIDMTGDHIVLHEEATINVNKVDIFVKKEMLAHDTNQQDVVNEIIQVARSDDRHMDEGNKYVNTSNRHDAYEAAYKMDANKTHTTNIGIMRPGLHTREDHVEGKWPPADNEVLAKFEYGEQPNVHNVPNVLSPEELSAYNMKVDKHEYEKEPEVQYNTTTPDDQVELPANNENLNEYEYSHNTIVMTNLTETLDAEKMLDYMNKNYENTSRMGDEDEPTTALENLYSIDKANREEDVANNERTNGVPNMKKPRGLL